MVNTNITIRVITARKRSLRRLCFYRCLSVHTGGMRGCFGGVHVFLGGGMCGFFWGGMRGFPGGACMVGPAEVACVVFLGGGMCGFF